MPLDTSPAAAPILSLGGIVKRFGSLAALDDVSTAFAPGRVHGVLGENGAGKSTLMRIAAGLLAPDAGTIATAGGQSPRWNPQAAAAAGVAMVHQHFMLVPSLTVAENCAVGRRWLGQWGARQRATQIVRDVGARTGLQVDPNVRVEALSVGEQQRAEIIRALCTADRGLKLLILDEPTAVLTPTEAEQLFVALDRLKGEGLAIVFISHKLGEVARLCDDLTILRKGQRVFAGAARELSQGDMAKLMVGASVAPLPARTSVSTPETVLSTRGVCAVDAVSRRAVREIDLEVRRGEIVGIAGVEGNGQDLLAALLAGVAPVRSGRILLAGADATRLGVRARAARGLANIPEDRLRQALVPGLSIVENLMLREYRGATRAGSQDGRLEPLSRFGLLRWSTARRQAADLIDRYDIRTPSPQLAIERLSGGNQQKVVLARELAGEPAAIIAHNPVRGLDVAATQFVFERLLAQRQRGAGILLIHSDLDELLAIADRLYVMFDGRLLPTSWPACDRQTIGRLMLGSAA